MLGCHPTLPRPQISMGWDPHPRHATFPAAQSPPDTTSHLGLMLSFPFLRHTAPCPLPSNSPFTTHRLWSLLQLWCGNCGVEEVLLLACLPHPKQCQTCPSWLGTGGSSSSPLRPHEQNAPSTNRPPSRPPHQPLGLSVVQGPAPLPKTGGCGKLLGRKDTDNGLEKRIVTSLHPERAQVPGVSLRICTGRCFLTKRLVPGVQPSAPRGGWWKSKL